MDTRSAERSDASLKGTASPLRLARWKFRAEPFSMPHSLTAPLHRHGAINMEVNQLKRQLKDLGERTASLRGFL